MLVRTVVVGIIGASCVACGSSGSSEDEEAIQALMEEYLRVYEDKDAVALTELFVDDCAALLDQATDEMEQLHSRAGGEISFELTSVDIRNLTESSAEVSPHGVGLIAGEEVRIGSESLPYTPLVKQDGDWKINECNYLAGGF